MYIILYNHIIYYTIIYIYSIYVYYIYIYIYVFIYSIPTKDQRVQVDRLQPELCNLFLQQPLLQPFFAMQNVQLEVLILTEMLQPPLNSACLSNSPNQWCNKNK